MHDVQAVTFPNADGYTLFGTLHRPAVPAPDLPAVVLLSPGVKMRVGPGRLYAPLTELLTSLGFTVLRFDFHGLGDSEGDLEEAALADVYNNIEVGRYVSDSLRSIEWLSAQHGFDRFILGGLCGGAITAVLTAQREKRVSALLSIGLTVTLSSESARPAKYLARGELSTWREGYIRRLLQPKSWWRLVTGKSEFGVMWRAMKDGLIKEAPTAPPPEAVTEQLGNANPLFPPAFFDFLQRGGHALMVFSEKDRLHSEYQEKFVALHQAQLDRFGAQLVEHVVPEANHVLSLPAWQREMLDRTRRWIVETQPAARAAS